MEHQKVLRMSILALIAAGILISGLIISPVLMRQSNVAQAQAPTTRPGSITDFGVCRPGSITEIPQVLKNGGGAIVNTSSVHGVIANPQLPIYVASKHAVLGLTKAAALEYAKAGIRINAVAPGAIETDMMEQSIGNDKQAREALVAVHPIGRAGKPLL